MSELSTETDIKEHKINGLIEDAKLWKLGGFSQVPWLDNAIEARGIIENTQKEFESKEQKALILPKIIIQTEKNAPDCHLLQGFRVNLFACFQTVTVLSECFEFLKHTGIHRKFTFAHSRNRITGKCC